MSDDTRRTADCERANRLTEASLTASLDEQSVRWLDAHRQICRECSAVAQALDDKGPLWEKLDRAPDVPPIPRLEVDRHIIAHLDGAPVSALSLESRPRLAIALFGLALVVLVPLLVGVRRDLASQPWTFVGLPVALLTAAFLAVLLTFDRLGRRPLAALAALALVGAPVTFLSVDLTIAPAMGSIVDHASPGQGFRCGALGLFVGLALLLPLIVAARRGMAGPTRFGAVLLGAATAAIGIAVLQIRCGIVDPRHLLLSHGLLFLVIPAVALLLRVSRRLA